MAAESSVGGVPVKFSPCNVSVAVLLVERYSVH
jgi:hypothetical protein